MVVWKQGGGGDGCGVTWQVISDLVTVRIARDRLTYYIHVIATHNGWPVSRVVTRLVARVHEVECSILAAVFLFLR